MHSPENPAPTTARDYATLSLALAFLFAGLGYGLPFFLFRESHPLNGPISPEILNLYSLTAWMGLAHFAFAYQGQFSAFRAGRASRAQQFVLLLTGGLIALILLRKQLSFDHFGFLIWIYFRQSCTSTRRLNRSLRQKAVWFTGFQPWHSATSPGFCISHQNLGHAYYWRWYW
ncbi:MAG TPA: hypothetical protein V6C52_06600 [Coleofasciculaceae cyanobacterium]|jgi:hypothetical protein